MRWRRGVLFAAIVAAHVLVVLYFPAGSVPVESAQPDVFFTALLAPGFSSHKAPHSTRMSGSRLNDPGFSRRSVRSRRTDGSGQSDQDQVVPEAAQAEAQSDPAASIDWTALAHAEVDRLMREDAQVARQAAALSGWRSRVMPAPYTPSASQFRWDHASTHRLESSPLGLTVNLSERCSILVSVYMMAIIGGCKVGEIPVHGDLFMHMKDLDPIPSAAP